MEHADERWDDLQNNGLRILQKKTGFRFGMDSVLLAHFARVKPRETVVDLGTGSAVLPLLLSQNEKTAAFHAFEWQNDVAEMASRSVQYNQLSERITIHCKDLRNADHILGKASAHVVVCNPPYGKKDNVIPNVSETKRLSRHETDCKITDILSAAASILKNQGRLYMTFPSHRMLELFDCMRQNHLEPKRLRMVCAKASKAPYLLLAEGVKNARPMLHWLPPLIVYNEDGTETGELKRIYLSGR
ncbi:MAG: tRNA1(Val) (adenine(37)-N6)-methyltransferase [Bacillota bacterium]